MTEIIGLHVMNVGGARTSFYFGSRGAWLIELVYIVLISSVNVFAMMSGYLCISQKKEKNQRIVELVFTCLFYFGTITAVFAIFSDYFNGLGSYAPSLFPPIDNKNWYIVCYFFLFFMIPFINELLNGLSKKRFSVLIVLLLILLSVIPCLGLQDYFRTDKGYSPWWLIVCYIIGAYIKLYGFPKIKFKSKLLLLLISILLPFSVWLLLENVAGSTYIGSELSILLVEQYVSPFIVFEAVMFLAIFTEVRVPTVLEKPLKYIAGCAFGVYIIHAHPMMMRKFITGKFAYLAGSNAFLRVLGVIGICVSVYAICTVVESLRILLFKAKPIKKAINFIGEKINVWVSDEKSEVDTCFLDKS